MHALMCDRGREQVPYPRSSNEKLQNGSNACHKPYKANSRMVPICSAGKMGLGSPCVLSQCCCEMLSALERQQSQTSLLGSY